MRKVLLGLAALGMSSPAMAAPVLSDNFDTPGSFTSDYTFIPNTPGGNTAGGQYTVAPNANPWNPNFASYGDNTTGNGNYLVVNGGGLGSVWQNAVAVLLTAGTNYTFSFALSDACCNSGAFGGVDPSPPSLGLSLNGSAPIATFGLAPNTPAGQWSNFSTSFVAQSTGLYSFSLTNLNTEPAGNDYGIDDISVEAAVPEPATWAMIIIGFGLMGFAMRRRGAVRTRVRFA